MGGVTGAGGGAHPFVPRADAHPEYGEQGDAAEPVLVGLDTGGGSLGYAFRPLPAASETRAEGARPDVRFGLAFMRDGGGR